MDMWIAANKDYGRLAESDFASTRQAMINTIQKMTFSYGSILSNNKNIIIFGLKSLLDNEILIK